jgi:hypothetical protein
MSRRHLLAGLTLCLALASSSPSASAQVLFRAELTGAQEVPPVTTTAGGLVTATLDGSVLIVRGAFSGLESDYDLAIGSHIHRGAEGANGPIVFPLNPALEPGLRGGTWYGPENRFPMDAEQIQALLDGLLYVNVHSLDNPGGEVRGQLLPAITLNEVRSDQPGSDVDEYVEIAGPAGASLDGYSFVVLGDRGSDDRGVIEEVIDLTGNTIPDDNAFLMGELTLATPDLEVDLNLENTQSVTYLLVQGVAGTEGDDLDADNDGVLDSNPWSDVADAVGALDDAEGASYGAALGFEDVGPDGTTPPGHLFRNRDDGLWRIGAFDPEGGFDTPGETNASTALVQIVHNAPDRDAETVDVYVNDGLAVDGLDYREATAFVLLPAGMPLALDVAPGGSASSDESVFGTEVTLDGSRSYYVVAVGFLGLDETAPEAFTLALYDNARRFSTTPGTVDVGFFHGAPFLAPDNAAVDVRTAAVSPAILFNAVPYGAFAADTYQPVGPGVLALEIVTAGSEVVLAQVAPDLTGLGGESVLALASGVPTIPVFDDTGVEPFGLLLVRADGSTALAPALFTSAEGQASGDGLGVRAPNPVRGTARVAFTLAEPGDATLEAFDALGRRVATLARGPRAAGEHAAEWDASGLAPGLYVLRLQVSGARASRAVTVVR